uniref:C2 domain-containing protein n=1 Tax=Parastrongyloides trichosuri TaxID=131310 RepID=A0A0N4ZIH3_PARTI
MNLLAKHFYDYQSFVNLPYKAIHLHKTPPNQAGCDPSASWGPKNIHVAGKNQPAPAARANRNCNEFNNSHPPHGKAAKLKHKKWGNRHGDYLEEKIIPHKDSWMKFLPGDTEHDCTMAFIDKKIRVKRNFMVETKEMMKNSRDSLSSGGEGRTTSKKNPLSIIECKEYLPSEILIILTYAPQIQFITVSMSKIRAPTFHQAPYIRVTLYDGIKMMEEKIANSEILKKGVNRKLSHMLRCNSMRWNDQLNKSADILEEENGEKSISTPSSVRGMYFSRSNESIRYIDESSSLSDRIESLKIEDKKIIEENNIQPQSQPEKVVIEIIETDKNHNTLNYDEIQALEAYESNATSSTKFKKRKGINIKLDENSNHKIVETPISASFLFKVNAKALHRYHLVIEVYDTINDKRELTGTAVLGALSLPLGSIHWRQMIRRKGQPVCLWHQLKETFENSNNDE